MQYEHLSRKHARQSAGDTVLSVCAAGVLESTVILPSRPGPQRPLLALHGISRNAVELSNAFASAAEATGRIVVVPHFTQDKWPVYQRITRRARPDKTLLSLFSTLRTMDSAFDGPLDIFGFSGGAQLAHRFAMLYPEAVGDLHLGAAGWYTLPLETTAYPYGIGDAQTRRDSWSRLMRSGLRSYLQRRIHVYVGANDTARDNSLRQNILVDEQQGLHRVQRARCYVDCVNNSQAVLGLPPTARLEILKDCDHSFNTCARQGGIALRVCEHD